MTRATKKPPPAGKPRGRGPAETARDATTLPRRGRPPAAGVARKRHLDVRWTDAEWLDLEARAAAAGLGLGAYVRAAALGRREATR